LPIQTVKSFWILPSLIIKSVVENIEKVEQVEQIEQIEQQPPVAKDLEEEKQPRSH
jgi:hypothetical protein